MQNAPEYLLFVVVSLISLTGCILGTYLTQPTGNEVLTHFYKITRPFGVWHKIRKTLNETFQRKINAENRRDIISTCIAVPWQLTLFLTGIMLVYKAWEKFIILAIVLVILSILLYKNWFKHLSKEVTESV